ncbi:MAG: acetyl-CoA carboxylase biotin carboxyl carrier protein [Candidatus Acidiferrales bacterium]
MAKKSKSGFGAGAHAEGVDLGEVKRLLAFMQENGLEEFEYERGGVHIRLKKASAAPAAAPYVAAAAPVASPVPPAPVAAPAPAAEAAKPAAAANVQVIKSPIVGTYYSSPSPEAEPFVTIGARVEAGQTLCIIEAMKLMNEIESDVAGEVVQVLVENGHPVEYGEPLFGIRTSGKK